MALDQNIGMVTAYAYARSKGYTGTEDEFAEALANAGVTLDQITDAVDEFIDTTVPAKVAEVTAEGTRQIGLVQSEGTAQISAVQSAGSARVTEVESAIEAKGAETLASIPDDYTALGNAVDGVKEKMQLVESKNIYNNATAQQGIAQVNGTKTASTSYYYSELIPVSEGDVIRSYYKNTNNSTIYTANMTKVCAYDSTPTAISEKGQDSSGQTYTVPEGIAYVQITLSSGVYATAVITKNQTEQPSAYIDYFTPYYIATQEFIDKAVEPYNFISGTVSKAQTDFWSLDKSANLFDKSDVITGKYFNPNGAGELSNASTMFASYVKIDGAGTYSFKVNATYLGIAGAKKILMFDKNKTFVKTLTADSSETTASTLFPVTLTVSETDITDGCVYLGYSQRIDQSDVLMVVKSATYPSEYIPYYERWTLPDLKNMDVNPLFGKVAVFDGDSICAGNGSEMGDYGAGWAGRISVDNDMTAYNVAVSGACITAETYFDGGSARHWVSRYIDTIHANYPDADYIIAEGGTNDADNFYGDPSKLGTFSETDFAGPFDDTTFYGAMDSWCQKALAYYPKAKIGFIVAQKMGLGFAGYTKNRYDYFTYAEKVCKKWGIPVLNLWEEGQLRPDVTSMYDPTYNTIETATAHGLPYYDGQHLTACGYDVISPKIEAWMKTL